MRPRLAILVNAIAPYRIPIYVGLAEHFETLVLHGGTEPNRSWAVEIPPGLKTQKVRTIQVPLRKRTGVKDVRDTSYVHLTFGLLWVLPRFRPDAIISTELGMRTVIALAYSKLMRTPLWVWWGGTLHSEKHIGSPRRWLRHFLADQVANWISYGASSTAYLQHLGVAGSEILQIQNCVPQPQFDGGPESLSSWFPGSPSPVILSTGQLIQRKGLDRLIEACGRLSAKDISFTLVLVGSGPERGSLIRQARNAGLKHFYLLENQTQATLYELYRRADVFVFPTLEDVWGLVVNEALLAGCPVLCSQYAGCAEELIPPANIFDPLSEEDFDRALLGAVHGKLHEASCGRLLTCEQVPDLMAAAIRDKLPTPTPPLVADGSVSSPAVSQELY